MDDTSGQETGARPCWNCRVAKVICDGLEPCGRCTTKKLDCSSRVVGRPAEETAKNLQERFMLEAEQELKATKEESLNFRYLRDVYLRVDETRAEEYMEWWKVHSPRTHAMYQLADRKNQQYDVASKRLAEREGQQKKIRDGTKLAGVTGNQVNERNPRKHKKRTSVPVVGEGSLEKHD